MDSELIVFLRCLNAEIADRLSSDALNGEFVYSESVFTEHIVDYLSEIGMVENAEVCYYESSSGRSTIKVNGYALNESEDRLDLFASFFIDRAEPAAVHDDSLLKIARDAVNFFKAACLGIHRKMEPASTAFDIASYINQIKEQIQQTRIFILTNGISTLKKIKGIKVEGAQVNFEVWDLNRLYRGMQAGSPQSEISIDFQLLSGASIPCLPMPCEMQDYTAYLAIIPGVLLYKLYDEYGPRLLELNVRSFLSARGKVNSGIRKSLREEPERFMAYNNGIVATVDTLQTELLPDGHIAIRAVKGLQIVNGGQTTVSIHRARKIDKVDVSSVFVPAKINVIKSNKLDEMVQMISHCANTQNTIQSADFSANDRLHIEIERLSNVIWCPDGLGRWFYERARGQYQVAKAREGSTSSGVRKFNGRTPPQRKLTKTELAKYLNSWEQRPNLVSLGAQKNFDHFMQFQNDINHSGWLPDESYYRQLIAKTILFRTAQKIVRQEKYPAYQANITTYLIAYLSWRVNKRLDFDSIWKSQHISESMANLLQFWSHDIERLLRQTAKGRMISEWAKKEACWEALKTVNLDLPNPLPREVI